MAGQQEAASVGRAELRPEHLLLGLLRDPLVVQALRASAGPELESLIRSVSDSREPTGNELRATAETNMILQSAFAIAAEAEWTQVQPGHILLAITRDPTCEANWHLVQLEVDLGCLEDCVVDLLARERSAKAVDAAHLRKQIERYARLTSEEVRDLVEQVSVWRQSCRLRREASPDEERELRRLADENSDAWLRLHQHHLYLALAAAEQCAARGHDLSYAYDLAFRFSFVAVFEYSISDDGPFDQYLRAYLREKVEERFRCQFADDWDVDSAA